MTAADRASDRVTDVLTQSQQAVADTLGAVSGAWAEALQRLSSPGLPLIVPADAVDRFFDTGVQILEAQRALVHGTLDAFRVATSSMSPSGR